jgi:hypothetical protein
MKNCWSAYYSDSPSDSNMGENDLLPLIYKIIQILYAKRHTLRVDSNLLWGPIWGSRQLNRGCWELVRFEVDSK